MNHYNFKNGKGLLFLILLIILSLPVFSIGTDFEDKYGSTSYPWMFGDFTDKVIFENSGDFNINLTPVTDEEMVCIEWNDYENEGGNENIFEPNFCFLKDTIYGDSEEIGCLNLVSDTLEPDTTRRNWDFDTLNFNMEDNNPYRVKTWVRSYHCIDTDPDNVTLEDSDTVDWFIIDEKKHDCDGSRSNDFDLEGYFINYDNNRAWLADFGNDPDCIDMVSAKNGIPYDAAGFGFASGEVQCDELQDDKSYFNDNDFILAQNNDNYHPCTINEGLDVRDSNGVYTCNSIDDYDCETGICNDDNRCGSCAINNFIISSSDSDDDTDDNFILLKATTFGQEPSWDQDNSDGGVDCIAYDYDNDGSYDICRGDDSVGDCSTLGISCSGSTNDVINIDRISTGTEQVEATVIDDSCNQEEDYFYTIQFLYLNILEEETTVTDYSRSSQGNQISTDTDEINLEFQTEGDTFLGYNAVFITSGESPSDDRYIGIFDSLTTYEASIDISSHDPDYDDDIDLFITAYIDDDVIDTFFLDSEDIYKDFVRNDEYYSDGEDAKTNRWIYNDFYVPATCEYLENCTIYDNYTISTLPTMYNYDINFYEVFPPRYIRTRFYNDDTNYLICDNLKDIYPDDDLLEDSVYNWAINSSCEFPYILSGRYNGRIEQCYQFWFSNEWFCEEKNIIVELPVNTFFTVMKVYNSTSEIPENYEHIKYESLDFCADDSYVGSNNTNVIFHLDYDGDGIEDGNSTLSNCITVNYGSNDSYYYINARGWITSNERFGGYYNFEYSVKGVCGDYVDDWNEYGIDDPNASSDWSEICWGTCYDNTLNGNEEQIDYKGRCGNCTGNSLAGDDIEWQLLKESKYLFFPFTSDQCIEVQGATGSFLFISFFGLFLLIILALILFGIAILLIFNLIGIKINFIKWLNPLMWLWFLFKMLIFGRKKQYKKKDI